MFDYFLTKLQAEDIYLNQLSKQPAQEAAGLSSGKLLCVIRPPLNSSHKINLPSNLRILVVEDEYFSQCIIKFLMDQRQIILAENGRNALDLLKLNTFDLILMDLDMPVMDGYTTIEMIRNELGITIPIIIVSGSTDHIALEKALKAGANDFLAKPYSSSEMFLVIVKNLGRTPGPALPTLHGQLQPTRLPNGNPGSAVTDDCT